MKKLMVAIAAAAISFAGFADDTNNWFTAGFGAEASSSGGAWSTSPAPTWGEGDVLVLDDVDAQSPVKFAAEEAKAGASTNADTTVVFDTTVLFQGFEELPAIDTDAKAGVCALTGGDYYVVAKVEDKNAWVDTGFAADFESAVKVKVTVANGKAVYSFGADSTESLDLVDAEFQEVCYSGNGSVTTLAADTILAGVAITLPTIDGLTVTCDKARAAVGESVLLKFAAGTKIPNRTEALYEVKANGELEFADDGDEPAGQDPGAKIGTAIYLTFADAYEAASEDEVETITLCTDQYLESDIDKSIAIDLAGNDLTVTNAVAINGVEVVFDDSAEEIKGKLVLGAELSVADDGASLVVSAITFECDGGYLTGVGGIISVSEDMVSANKMLAEGYFGEEPEGLSVIVYVGESVYNGADDRFAIEGEVAYATVGEEGAQYIESFASVQAAIEAADEVYLCFEHTDVEYIEEEIEFGCETVVYAATGEDDLQYCTLLPEGEVVFDGSLGAKGGWKIPGEPPTPTFVAKIGDVEYATLAEAVTAAIDGQTITLLANIEQAASIDLTDKELTFDLGAKTLTFNGCKGFFFNGVGGTVKNGTIVMTVPAGGTYAAIEFLDANGLVKDVVINSGNAEDGVVCWSNGEAFNGKTVVCENVDVTGSGRNFYAETAAMTLDANCSATQVGAYTGDPANSTALAAGWLGQLTVNGGAYTAEANVVGTMSSPAKITLNAGTYSGNFNYVPVAEGYKYMGDHDITKNVAVELAAPAGYEWSVAVADMQKLVKTYTITYVDAVVTNGMTKYTVETETFALPTAADVEERSGGQFKGWTNEVGTAVTEVVKGTTGDLTFYAVWEAAGVFYPTYIDQNDADLKEKFNDWATNKNAGDRDGASANIDAFLLNCAPSEVETAKAAFKIVSITKTESGWVCKVAGDIGEGGEYGNGYVHFVSVKDDKFPTADEGADFFQATLTIKPTL